MTKKKKPEDDSAILEEINKHINLWVEYSKDNISRGQDDKYFLYVNQWSSSQESELNRLDKPILSFNKTYDIIRKVLAEQRNQETQFKVSSLWGKSTQEEINVFKGAVMKIVRDSDTNAIFNQAYDDAASSGVGVWRVYTDYEHERSLNQLPKIGLIADSDKCFWSTSSIHVTKSDSDFCGYYQEFSKSSFHEHWPDIPDPSSFSSSLDQGSFKWMDKDTITVVEYYKKEWFNTEKYQLNNGEVLYKEEYEARMEESEGDTTFEEEPPLEIVKKIKSKNYKIIFYKAIKDRILEKAEWPGRYLPLVRVVCDKQRINGKEHINSLVSFVKDAQMFHNLVKVEIAQAIKFNRREQWASHPDSVSPYTDMWKNPSIQQGVLLYQYDANGGKPERLPPAEISQTLIEQARLSEMDIQSILGMYEANVGANGNELSGKAIRERRKTGFLSASILNDNFNEAVQQTGKIIGDLLQKVVDSERTLSIYTEDGKGREVRVNHELLDGQKENDFSKDMYDITIDPGPSFAIQKADSLDVLINLVQINPGLFPFVADIIGQNIDINGSEKLKERLRELVPEAIRAKEEGREPPPPAPDPMQMLLQEQIQTQNKELDIKQQKNQADAALQEQKQQLEFVVQNQKTQQEEMKLLLERMRLEQEIRSQENQRIIEEMKYNMKIVESAAKAFSSVRMIPNEINESIII